MRRLIGVVVFAIYALASSFAHSWENPGFKQQGQNVILLAPTSNVGLGSASPRSKLDVNGTIYSTGITFGTTGPSVISPASALEITNAVTIEVGTTTNPEALYIVGSGNTILEATIQNTSTGNNAQACWNVMANNGTLTTGYAAICKNNTGFSFTAPYNVGGPSDASFINNDGSIYLAAANVDGAIYFVTGGAALSNRRAVIDGTGNVGIGTVRPRRQLEVNGTIYISGTGNLGIGTVNPAAALDVRGVSGEIARFANGASASDTNYIAYSQSRTMFGHNGSRATAVFQGSSGKGIDIIGDSSTFGTPTGVGLFIKSDGNLGVGTQNPRALLEVDRAPYNVPLIFTTLGNLGIGVVSPNATLDVGGASKTSVLAANSALVKGDIEADGKIYADTTIYFGASPKIVGTCTGGCNTCFRNNGGDSYLYFKATCP